jgi:magnesium transporter
LFKLADTERKIVYLDHTLADQKSTLNGLWENESFIQDLNDSKLVYDIQLHQKHAEKLIHIYRDLLETVGGLFTDMMDNNLNHLMKYLDSAALIISIPALISGIWGMNTGGLPGKGSSIGFFMVVGVAVLLAIIVAVHLNRKDFSK